MEQAASQIQDSRDLFFSGVAILYRFFYQYVLLGDSILNIASVQKAVFMTN